MVGYSMKSNKHILILIPGFASDETDSSCIPPVQDFLKAYKSIYEKDIITIISFQYPYTKNKNSWHGINVWNAGGRNKKLLKPFVWQRVKRYFKLIHEKEKVSIIHAFWLGECAYIGKQLADQYQIPFFITLMGQDVLKKNKYLSKSLFKNTPTIALSKNHAEIYYANSGKKATTLIPWGINLNEKKHEKKIYDIIGVGSLNKLKNYNLFINLIHEIRKIKPDMKALLIGDGDEKIALEQQIKRLELDKNITLLGQIKREEVLEFMNKSKILLHTSSYESFGYVFVEALSRGNIIVSLNVGCATPSTNWLVAENNEGLLKLVIKALNQDFEECTNTIISSEQTANAYNELYNQLITK